MPGVLGELAQQQELQPGEVHRAVADVRHQPGHVEGDLAGPDDLAAQPDSDPDPGEQFGQRERLGQVILGAAFEQINLGGHVGDAGEHEDGLGGAGGEQLAEHLAAVQVGHHQVEDDQVIAGLQGAGDGVGAVA